MSRMPRKVIFVSGCLALCLTSVTAQAQQNKNALRIKRSQPAAFVACFQDYKGDARLTHPVDSGVKFAQRLLDNGYAVTFVTDPERVQDVEERLTATPASSLAVESAKSGVELGTLRQTWQARYFEQGMARPPFGIVAFNGHGVERAGGQYFLTPGDDAANGGLSIRDVQKSIGKIPLSIVMIVDTCRTRTVPDAPVDKAVKGNVVAEQEPGQSAQNSPRDAFETSPMIDRNRGTALQPMGLKGNVGDDHAHYGVLTIYSTLIGKVATDSTSDLMSLLAEGLSPVDQPRSFLARRQCGLAPAVFSRTIRDDELPLMAWFNYALRELPAHTINQQTGTIELGYVDQSMIVASRQKNYVYPSPDLSLLAGWDAFSGEFKAQRTAHGITIRRPPDTNPQHDYLTGFLDTLDRFEEPINPVGKSLVVELVAESAAVPPDNAFLCSLAPGNASVVATPGGDTTGNQFWSQWGSGVQLPLGKLTQVVIPFDRAFSGHVLRSMSIGAYNLKNPSWPVGATVTITRMTVVDRHGAIVPQKPRMELLYPAGDLLAHWWPSDNLFGNPELPVKVHAKIAALPPNRRHLSLKRGAAPNGTLAGKGGPVYPPLFAHEKHSKAIIVLEPMAGGPDQKMAVGPDQKKYEIQVEMRGPRTSLAADDKPAKDISLVRYSKTVPEGRRITLEVPILSTGFIDYLGITTDAENVVISSMELLPQRGTIK